MKNNCWWYCVKQSIKNTSTQDGVKSWFDLKQYYDQEGNKNSYSAKLLGKLADLKLQYNSYGGMDRYISEFEAINLKLDDISKLDENTKKTFFLRRIQDRDYGTKKDICALGYPTRKHYKNCEIRQKS